MQVSVEQRPGWARLGACLVALVWLALQLLPLPPPRSYAATGARAGTICSQEASSSDPTRESQQHGACGATACSACACVFFTCVDQRVRTFEPIVAILMWRLEDYAAPEAAAGSYFRARGPPPILKAS